MSSSRVIYGAAPFVPAPMPPPPGVPGALRLPDGTVDWTGLGALQGQATFGAVTRVFATPCVIPFSIQGSGLAVPTASTSGTVRRVDLALARVAGNPWTDRPELIPETIVTLNCTTAVVLNVAYFAAPVALLAGHYYLCRKVWTTDGSTISWNALLTGPNQSWVNGANVVDPTGAITPVQVNLPTWAEGTRTATERLIDAWPHAVAAPNINEVVLAAWLLLAS